MHEFTITAVITTYNRVDLLTRAIQSVLDQKLPTTEIIVVDDASTDRTREVVAAKFPRIRYLRQHINMGPGEARNRGIREASSPWILLMDDDDTLSFGAFETISRCMKSFETDAYPVVQFATSNGAAPRPFLIVRLKHYIKSALKGDFTPVVQKKLFLSENYHYPKNRIGGENLLWWKIAEKHGIPTWSEKVVQVGHDAPVRLTSCEHQARNAREYAKLQEATIEEFGETMNSYSPDLLMTKRLGAATYWLLDGERALARGHLESILKNNFVFYAAVLWYLSYFPARFLRYLFRFYRWATR